MVNSICIISFYKFIKISNLNSLKLKIEKICKKFETKGTILIAPEGINGTIEGSDLNIKRFLKELKIDKSLFKRFLNNGFDGISTNPNYKMLALLIVLLINLSLFFVIGNMGKAFLRNAGIMG